MKDLDRLVEEYFKPKEKKKALDLQALLEMVERVIDDAAEAKANKK